MTPITITIDTTDVLATFDTRPVGINLNYLRDSRTNRPDARPIEEVLGEMNVAYLRYPGGGKSDMHLWSVAPWDRPAPQVLGDYQKYAAGHSLMDFDEYITVARAVGAEPYVVVAYNREDRCGVTRKQFLENAVQWVRYANVTKRYNVRYWEIGNENWGYDKATPAEMAEIVCEFSAAMKAVDPTIRVGSNGFGADWWQTFLPIAAPHLDFLTTSIYPCSGWGSYEHYATTPDLALAEQAEHAAAAIDALPDPAGRDRLFIAVPETNSMDYGQDGWPNRNNLGHALATVEIIGRILLTRRVRFVMLWNTRWVDPEPETIWYALAPDNTLLPAGEALAAWGRNLHGTLVAARVGTRSQKQGTREQQQKPSVANATSSASSQSPIDNRQSTIPPIPFATHNPATGDLSILLINKSATAAAVTLTIQSDHTYAAAEAQTLQGTGPEDMRPAWHELPAPSVATNTLTDLTLPPASLTVIRLA